MTEITVQDVPGTQSTVRLAAAGDETAFAHLIATHNGAMTRVAYVTASDWATAGEAVQAAWTIAWDKLRNLREEDRIEPWLVSIAANETRKLLARQRRRTVVEISTIPEKAHSADPADLIGLVDLGRALRKLGPEPAQSRVRARCGAAFADSARVDRRVRTMDRTGGERELGDPRLSPNPPSPDR